MKLFGVFCAIISLTNAYFVIEKQMGWTDGQAACEAYGVDLATIKSGSQRNEARCACGLYTSNQIETRCDIGLVWDPKTTEWGWTEPGQDLGTYGFDSLGKPTPTEPWVIKWDEADPNNLESNDRDLNEHCVAFDYRSNGFDDINCCIDQVCPTQTVKDANGDYEKIINENWNNYILCNGCRYDDDCNCGDRTGYVCCKASHKCHPKGGAM